MTNQEKAIEKIKEARKWRTNSGSGLEHHVDCLLDEVLFLLKPPCSPSAGERDSVEWNRRRIVRDRGMIAALKDPKENPVMLQIIAEEALEKMAKLCNLLIAKDKTIAEFAEALNPIRDWYGGDTEGDRSNLEILTDAIADLRKDRTQVLEQVGQIKELRKITNSLVYNAKELKYEVSDLVIARDNIDIQALKGR